MRHWEKQSSWVLVPWLIWTSWVFFQTWKMTLRWRSTISWRWHFTGSHLFPSPTWWTCGAGTSIAAMSLSMPGTVSGGNSGEWVLQVLRHCSHTGTEVLCGASDLGETALYCSLCFACATCWAHILQAFPTTLLIFHTGPLHFTQSFFCDMYCSLFFVFS